jgi:peptidyl-tRNA hydrolase ICT1
MLSARGYYIGWKGFSSLRPVLKRWRTNAAAPTEDEIAACRQWMTRFNPDTIPKRLCDISYSRSSGPGGQNVNK